PYFLALIGKVMGRGIIRVVVFQHILGALAPVLVYRLTARVFDKKSGLSAAAIGVFYGPAVFYESRFLGEFFIFFFNLAALWLLVRASDDEHPTLWWALGGFCLGLSTIFRPTVLAFLPAVLAWAFWTLRSKGIKQLTLVVAVFVLGLWLPLFPFQIRNRIVDPKNGWGLTTASGGVNLYIGNNPEANGLNDTPSFVRYGPGHEYEDFKEEAQRRAGKTLSPKEVSSFWTRETLRWFQNRPADALRLLFKKMGYFWNYREAPDNFFPSLFDKFTRIGRAPLLSWGMVAPLGMLGLLLSWRKAKSEWLLQAYVLTYLGVNVLFYVLSRYRFPVVAGLIPFAGLALARFYENVHARRVAKVAGLLFLLLPCWGLTRMPLIGEEDMAVTHYSLGVIFANQGWKDKAAEEYRASIRADPAYKASYLNLAVLQAGRNEPEETLWALEHLAQLEKNPRQLENIRRNIDILKRGLGKTAGPSR
ncbi:MAG: glycosyltransferase family 39 protein, partial [Elusimicrobia bacterium]|nr:glycosyltransferase family 39 protein [Elusimicrobiota bacterium]